MNNYKKLLLKPTASIKEVLLMIDKDATAGCEYAESFVLLKEIL